MSNNGKKNTWPVTPAGRVYQVMLPTGDSGALQAHYVDTAVTTCSCRLGPRCPAVHEVRGYLAAGGTRAGKAVIKTAAGAKLAGGNGGNGHIPASCPICGAAVVREHFGHHHQGWRCQQGGLAHYYQSHYGYLKNWLTRPPSERLIELATPQERVAFALTYPAGA